MFSETGYPGPHANGQTTCCTSHVPGWKAAHLNPCSVDDIVAVAEHTLGFCAGSFLTRNGEDQEGGRIIAYHKHITDIQPNIGIERLRFAYFPTFPLPKVPNRPMIVSFPSGDTPCKTSFVSGHITAMLTCDVQHFKDAFCAAKSSPNKFWAPIRRPKQ